jgi:methylmalonyl-CoA/ethylmalonyl-CoA epimerase
MSPRFLAIDHLGVAVSDLDAAEKTYRDDLGFEIHGGETLPERGLAVRFASVGDSRIELIAPTRADSEVSSFLDKRGAGLHHICLRVADLDAVLAEMRQRGVRLIDEKPRLGAHGRRVAFVHPKSAAGVLLELVEIPGEP